MLAQYQTKTKVGTKPTALAALDMDVQNSLVVPDIDVACDKWGKA